MKHFDKNSPQTSFGAFKPVGHLVAVFEDGPNAKLAHADLLTGGYTDDDLTFMDSTGFISLLDELKSHENALSMLGSELGKMDDFRRHADRGAGFLIIEAPTEQETKRAMQVVERYNYRYALKYGHMIVERFDNEHRAA